MGSRPQGVSQIPLGLQGQPDLGVPSGQRLEQACGVGMPFRRDWVEWRRLDYWASLKSNSRSEIRTCASTNTVPVARRATRLRMSS